MAKHTPKRISKRSTPSKSAKAESPDSGPADPDGGVRWTLKYEAEVERFDADGAECDPAVLVEAFHVLNAFDLRWFMMSESVKRLRTENSKPIEWHDVRNAMCLADDSAGRLLTAACRA